jgi:hypothetical protein
VSVWGTIWDADGDDHTDGCRIWVPVGEGGRTMGRGKGRACSCGQPNAPIAYRGSHILPSETDRRQGSVSLALVPGHITRDGRDDGPDDENGVWPWLRLSVGQEDAVLDEQLARGMHEALGEWLTARGAHLGEPGQPDSGSATLSP